MVTRNYTLRKGDLNDYKLIYSHGILMYFYQISSMYLSDLSFLPSIFLLLVLAFVFILIASYIFKNFSNNKLIFSVAVVILFMGIAFVFESILNHPLDSGFFNVLMRIYLVFTTFVQFSLLVSSLLFYEKEFNKTLEWQRHFIFFVVIPYIVIRIILMFFTNFYFNDDLRILSVNGEFKVYGIPLGFADITSLAFQIILYGISILNVYLIYKSVAKDIFQKRSRFFTLLSVILTAVGGIIASLLNFLESTGIYFLEPRDVWVWGQRVIFFMAVFSFFIGFVKYSAMINIGKGLIKDFISFTITVLIFTSIYAFPILFIVKYIPSPNSLPLILIISIIFPVLTHNLYDFILRNIRKLIDERTLNNKLITIDEVNFVLKNAQSIKALSNSKLLDLESVKIRSKQKSIDREEALQKIIIEAQNSLKPKDINEETRSANLIKFEILRMIIEEQASESQILWDLGFESRSVLNNMGKSRYPVRKNSEYRSVSINSYKRLRKKAILEFIWQLELIEAKILRNR